MDELSPDPLEKILAKLDALQRQLDAVNQRVEQLETPRTLSGELPRADEQTVADIMPPVNTLQGREPLSAIPIPDLLPEIEAPASAAAESTGSIDCIFNEMAAGKPAQSSEQARSTLPEMPPPPLPPAVPPAMPSQVQFREKKKLVPPPGESLEMRIGATWLSRIGILALALVLVLFAREHVQGPVGKVVGSYLLSIALIGVGLFYEKKFARWAGPVLAAGLAFSYFASYAMGFVEPMRLLDSLPLKLLILGVNLLVIFGFAQWKRSEAMAGTALLLGYLTTGVVGNDAAALGSCLALSVIAIFFLWLNQWFVSTAVAAGASYAAWLYVLKTMPHEAAPGARPTFWFHLSSLTLLFIVFVVASWVGAGILQRIKRGERGVTADASVPAGGLESILTALAQTNVAAYISAVVWLFWHTEVYWSRNWQFFFPMVGVCAGLGLVFRAIRPVQVVYALGAAACLAFGIISLATPLWMPIFLVAQALAMLVAARRRSGAAAWNALSFIVLLYACVYTLSGHEPGAPGSFYGYAAAMEFPAWVFALVAGATLAYAILWEKGPSAEQPRGSFLWTVPYMMGALAAVVWVQGRGGVASGWDLLYAGAAVPLAGLAAVGARSSCPTAAVIFAALISAAFYFESNHAPRTVGLFIGYWALLPTAFATGLLAERRGCGEPAAAARVLWRTIYLWAQFVAVMVLSKYVEASYLLAALTLLYAVSVAAGWFLRTAAVAKSGWVALAAVAICAVWQVSRREVNWTMLTCPAVLLAAAYLPGLAKWPDRTGDATPWASAASQAVALAIGGWIFVFALGAAPYGVDKAFAAGVWCLVCAVYAAAGLFAMAVPVALGSAALAGLLLWSHLLDNAAPNLAGPLGDLPHSGQPLWSLAGVLLIVAAERVLKFAPVLSRDGEFNPHAPWPSEKTLRWITIWMAVGTLAMAVVCLRLVPELRMFYFTGALVAAAFVWIVLGFWFREAIYRQAGLVLLCGGIVKGLVWDVLSLKNTMYRQISWTVLGVLAIGASFLYNRFRGRVGE
jgi:hypothetical protein